MKQLYTWKIGPDGDDTVSVIAPGIREARGCILMDAGDHLTGNQRAALHKQLQPSPLIHGLEPFYSFNADHVCIKEAKDWIV